MSYRFAKLNAVASLSLLATLSPAQEFFQERNPMTFTSPNGRAKLWVNPSNPYGEGRAFYRVTLNGRIAWQRTLPFSFREAGIADNGVIGGYAYPETPASLDHFVIAIVDARGRVVGHYSEQRRSSRIIHGLPNPHSRGMMFDPANDRMIVRVIDEEKNGWLEEWRVFSLSTGRKVSTLSPEGKVWKQGVSISQARALPGTSLVVVNWYRYDQQTDKMGQFFTLIDEAARPVWRLDLPGDYESGASSGHEFELLEAAMRKGTILRSDQRHRFEIRIVKSAERVTFQAKRAGNKWVVTEVHRAPYREPVVVEPPPLKTRLVQLPIRSKVTLPRIGEPVSEVRAVGEFHFWQDDKFVFLRNEAPSSICVVDVLGRLVRNMRLPNQAREQGTRLFLAKMAGSKFVLVSTNDNKAPSRAWRADVATGQFEALPKFRAFWVKSAAGYPDGRFVVLSAEFSSSSMSDHISLYSPDGAQRWDICTNGYSGTDDELLSPEDVDIDAEGRIVVLDVIRHSLQFFNATGKFQKILDLDKKWGFEASYPTEITCLPDGGFWLYDSGEKPCYLLDQSGGIQRRFQPTFPSGKNFKSREAIRVDRDGKAWITNGTSLYRLDDKGVAAQTIGNGPRLRGFGEIAELEVSPNGRIHALDKATMAVHVFDRTGKLLFTAAPEPKEFEDDATSRLTITRSGDIYVGWTVKGDLLHFSPNGKRLAALDYSRGAGSVPPFKAKPTWHWWGGTLRDDKGRAVGSIRRWPDQAWMSGPDAFAQDGRMMAYEGTDWLQGNGGPKRLAFFAANGLPESQVYLPRGMPESPRAAYDGRRCYFVTEMGLIALDRNGRALWTYRPEGWDSGWKAFPSLGNIALYDGKRTVFWVDPSA